MTKTMSLEEEGRMMRAAGCVLRRGTGPDGKPIEYWDAPPSTGEHRAAQEVAKKTNGAGE